MLDRGRRGPAFGRCLLGGRGSAFGASSSGEDLDGTRVEPAVVLGVAVAPCLHFNDLKCARVASDIVVKSVLGPAVLEIDTSPLDVVLPLCRGFRGVQR